MREGLCSSGGLCHENQPRVCLDNRPDSPPAGWKIPGFFIKMLHCVQHFYEKAKTSTMLPQADYTVIGSKRLVFTHTA